MVRLNRESRMTIIMVTHDPRAAEKAQVIRLLEKGFMNHAHSQAPV
jgi:putative ABC transport system ATP-binding protein